MLITAAVAFMAWPAMSPPAHAQINQIQTPWQKWLSEDVTYIITDAERNAFLQLATDDERAQFVNQFWLRRDPTPATPDNEFKDEHYRRIGYANGRFTSQSGVQGWKTDRGRIYITFGPPDEIDSHPAGENGGQTPAHETWQYRFIDGVGNNVLMEFVDTKGLGEFPMTRDPAAPN
jgi:GWxTD domain-containing protein